MYVSEEKAKRIAVGATVAGVLLVLFLVVVLIIQFVQIGVRNAEKKRLEAEIARYEEMIEKGEKNLEYYSSSTYLDLKAREWGWRYPDEDK